MNRVGIAYLGGVIVGTIAAIVALLGITEDEDREERRLAEALKERQEGKEA